MTERILVCGDRNYNDVDTIYDTLQQYDKDTIIIHGNCKGADKIAGNVARKLGMSVIEFPAQWSKYGKAAGPIRNKQMLEDGCPTLVLAFHKNINTSKGTKNMITQSTNNGLFVILYE